MYNENYVHVLYVAVVFGLVTFVIVAVVVLREFYHRVYRMYGLLFVYDDGHERPSLSSMGVRRSLS